MKYEIVNPLLNDFVGFGAHKFLEIGQFPCSQRWHFGDGLKCNSYDFAISDGQFGFAFSALIEAMHVDRFVFIGVEEHHQPEVQVQFRHWQEESYRVTSTGQDRFARVSQLCDETNDSK
jgi:hypothetical protein